MDLSIRPAITADAQGVLDCGVLQEERVPVDRQDAWLLRHAALRVRQAVATAV